MDTSLATVTGGAVFGSVIAGGLAQAAASAEPTNNLLLIAVVAGGFTTGGAILSTFITAHFQGKTAMAIAAATAHAAEAARAAQLAVAKTDEVAKQNIVISGALDGKLTELIRLSRAESEAIGVEKERVRGEALAITVAEQGRTDAATVRSDAQADRQEVRDAAAVDAPPAPVSGKTNDPVHMIITNPDPVPVRETPVEDEGEPKHP